MANRFNPIASTSSLPAALAQINRNFQSLDSQTYTDVKDMGGSGKIVNGKQTNVSYGYVLYDNLGKAAGAFVIRKNGKPWLAISKTGRDVFEDDNDGS